MHLIRRNLARSEFIATLHPVFPFISGARLSFEQLKNMKGWEVFKQSKKITLLHIWSKIISQKNPSLTVFEIYNALKSVIQDI